MSEDTVPVAAPAAAATSAPAGAPSASAAPPVAPASAPSGVDPHQFPIREDYAAALLSEKLAAIPLPDASVAVEETITVTDPAPETAAAPETPETPAASATDDDFLLDPPTAVTPEALSQMVNDHPELGRLLESDARLKAQLYTTAREAAELKPYRELFPDLDSAQSAQHHASTWLEVRDTFAGSTTREGTMASLSKIAELTYERDGNGQVVMRNGKPVIGEDFFGFVNNVVGLDLEHRAQDVAARLKANLYRSPEDRARDQQVHDALSLLRAGDPAGEGEPETVRRRTEELDRREQALNARQHGERVEERRGFERSLQTEAQQRIHDGIEKILAHVDKQGGAVSPYLKTILPQAIGAKLIARIQANPALQGQMQSLQRLPIGDASRQRRLAAIDRAVQQYLPEVARAELREAGVQIANASAARRAKVDAQIDSTKKTEPKGSTGPASGGAMLSSGAAYDQAQAEWQRANPGRSFDKVARELILPRVLQLMTAR